MDDRIKHLGIGIGAILTGCVEYLVYRPWGNGKGTLIDAPIQLVDKNGIIETYLHSIPNYFGDIHGWMPDYLGTLGGSLLCIGLANARTKTGQGIPLGIFMGCNLLNEVGQYFDVISGTYDTKDVLAVLGGAITAGIIARLTTKKEKLEDKLIDTQSIESPNSTNF